jgi:hypothetical protein
MRGPMPRRRASDVRSVPPCSRNRPIASAVVVCLLIVSYLYKNAYTYQQVKTILPTKVCLVKFLFGSNGSAIDVEYDS